MKFTRKQMSAFKKLHPEAVCPGVIAEAKGMYERGISYADVCKRVKRSLTTRQKLPWIKPKYNPEKYPKAEFEPDLEADDLLKDLDKYADLATDIIQEKRSILGGSRFGADDAAAYFRSSQFDFHQLVINCHRLLSYGNVEVWVDADLYRETLSSDLKQDTSFLAAVAEENCYMACLGQAFFTLVKSQVGRVYNLAFCGLRYNPKVAFKPFPDNLTADDLLRDIDKYSVFAEGIIEQKRTDLVISFHDDAARYFKSAEFDFHLLVVNCRNWLIDGDKRRWVSASVFRENLSKEVWHTTYFLNDLLPGSGYKGCVGMFFLRKVKRVMDEIENKKQLKSIKKAILE